MSHPDLDKIFKKPGEKRYDIFIKEVIRSEEVFGIADEEGWTLLGDDDDTDILPLFPAPELAEAFRAKMGYDDSKIAVLDVTELMEWLDDMEQDGMKVAVLPNLHLNGAVVAAAHLKEDLQKEFDKEK